MNEPEIRRWGAGRTVRLLFCVPPLAAVVLTIVAPEFWPMIVVATVPLLQVVRREVRITDHELILRHVVGTTRVPRHEVAFAKFEYKLFGDFLEIHRRDGTVTCANFLPKMSSPELSGDPPPPDSVAYQVTRWAQYDEPPP